MIVLKFVWNEFLLLKHEINVSNIDKKFFTNKVFVILTVNHSNV